jgi:hypothetical protein
MVCVDREMMEGDIIAEGGGHPTTEAAAREQMRQDLDTGGELIQLPPGPGGWAFGVVREGQLIARVRLMELSDGTWLVSAAERCV